jgi:glutamine synthetase
LTISVFIKCIITVTTTSTPRRVFTKDVIEIWFEYKRKKEVDAIRLGPYPWEFALYFDI